VAWDQYVTSPWTRDGSIRVQVASIAPQVSGQITQLRITDNQFVQKGDILYKIEPFDFDVTLRTSKALLEEREADQHVKQLQSERRQRLSDLATTPEEQQVFQGNAVQAKAAVDAAREQVAQADINLKRTEVHSPVNGYVTNLLLRVGDYAHAGVNEMNADAIDTGAEFRKTVEARLELPPVVVMYPAIDQRLCGRQWDSLRPVVHCLTVGPSDEVQSKAQIIDGGLRNMDLEGRKAVRSRRQHQRQAGVGIAAGERAHAG
jgi:multidrug efflux pump subunit AcrA (membrane-fusion protein)